MKRYIDATTDPDCQSLLADLEALAARAETLSERFDHEHVGAGKCWGVTHALREALASARSEFGAEEE